MAPTPVAVSDTEVEFVKNEIADERVPVAVGAKVTVNGTLWPAASVIGTVSPAILKVELLELTEDSVTLPPLAVTLPLRLWVVPIVTLPKLIEPGVNVSVPLAIVPLPVREMLAVESEASEVRVRIALSVPEAVGEKLTGRFALVPAARM